MGEKAPTDSTSLKIQYDLILRMALPYGTYGCKNYHSDKLLKNVYLWQRPTVIFGLTRTRFDAYKICYK